MTSALKVFCYPQPQYHSSLNRSLKPNPMSNESISSVYKEAPTIGSDLEERNRQAESHKQPAAEEHASRLLKAFQPVGNILLTMFSNLLSTNNKQGAEDKFFSRWPLNEDNCLSAGLGTKCDPFCAYCGMKDVCIPCALKPCSMEAGVDQLCPLRIPGCRFVNSKMFFFVRDPRSELRNILQGHNCPCPPELFW